jgi:NADP-reducing hydrogenase subunit HndB
MSPTEAPGAGGGPTAAASSAAVTTGAGATPGKIKSPADLLAIKERTQKENALREDGYHVLATVHMGTCGIASGSREVLSAMIAELNASDRLDVRVATSGCIGACEHEPVMTVQVLDQPKVIYGDLTAEKVKEVWQQHIMDGRLITQYVVSLGGEE